MRQNEVMKQCYVPGAILDVTGRVFMLGETIIDIHFTCQWLECGALLVYRYRYSWYQTSIRTLTESLVIVESANQCF